ncbi:MAG: hypothetical protein H0W68_11870 [Gemmatimonadaceae bacterium]|nr:hypothetical protein [Gemmatimonadaceae bacterium]
MHPDVQQLLAVQVDDLQLYVLEDRLASLAPRLTALEREREAAARGLERAKTAVEQEESRHRESLLRVESNRALVERSQRAYESVTTPKEANAAMTQLEQTKRMVGDAEQESTAVQGRINELRHRVADFERTLAETEERQAEARTAIGTERDALLGEIDGARATRDARATSVPRPLLSKYDRVRVRRRSETVFPLRGVSCSACDTAIPTQRRSVMASTGSLEMCEGCGVLLYAAE